MKGRTMTQYRKKPVVVDAIQYPCEHAALQRCTCEGTRVACSACGREFINTFPDGMNILRDGDWIITDDQGRVSSCKSDVFEATYEKVE